MTTPSEKQSQSQENTPASLKLSPDDLAARITWLAKEMEGATQDPEKSLLAFEGAMLRERRGDEGGAARDYLAAYNADPDFREPVEELTILLERRKSFKNMGRLLDAIARAANIPAHAARAHLLKGMHALEFEHDFEHARESFEEALSILPDLAGGWLELEMIAAKTDDPELRSRALEERARLAAPSEWRFLLLLDLSKLLYAQGLVDDAVERLREAAKIDSRYVLETWKNLERIARSEKRHDLLAEALEQQATFIIEQMSGPAEQRTIPRYMQSAARVAELFLQAAGAKAENGYLDQAADLLRRADEKLPDDPLLAYARMEIAEAQGDLKTSSETAARLLQMGIEGSSAAALWMRVFEQAAATGERDRAMEALSKALEQDPGSVPARALQLELVLDQDPANFASSLEVLGEQGLSDVSRGRLYLLAAWAWAMAAQDVTGAKAALSQAGLFGVEHGLVARLGRALASALGDDVWYGESTKRLLAAGAAPDDIPSLWFEAVRARLKSGSFSAALDAIQAMSHEATTAWLGRVLSVYALGLVPSSQDDDNEEQKIPGLADRIKVLAEREPDPMVGRALTTMEAIERARGGDRLGALALLQELYDDDPSSLLVAVLVSDLSRASGNDVGAAQVLSTASHEIEDSDVACALSLEAGFLAWRAGEKSQAMEYWGRASDLIPELGAVVLTWASAATAPEDMDTRRRVLEWQEQSGVDERFAALERFGVEAGEGGDPTEASTALELLETKGGATLGLSAALGHLISPDDFEAPALREGAFSLLGGLGRGASAVVAAEQTRLARTVDQDPEATCDYARRWSLSSDEIAPVLEWAAAAFRSDDPESEALAVQTLASRLDSKFVGSLVAQTALLEALHAPPGLHPALLDHEEEPAKLMNLEMAPAGSDPRRRGFALKALGDVLGQDIGRDATALAGWSLLSLGKARESVDVFRAVVDEQPDDMPSWEGLRAAAVALKDTRLEAESSERLGDLSGIHQRAAEFYEQAGLLWLDGLDEQRGEAALAKGFARDGTRFVTFDKLFRRVRARDDHDYMLRLIARRLEFAEDTVEIAKMFWERARVLRAQGNMDDAMDALENVTMLEPDHVGALALSGEVYIRKGKFESAVDMFERLAVHREAPKQQRLVSGMAAVDLCENQLKDLPRALKILLALHRSDVSTLAVRERIARLAPALEAWTDATDVLDRLMVERKTSAGRVEAARLSMVIYRDRLEDPAGAFPAINELLEELPGDREALDTLLNHPQVGQPADRASLLSKGRVSLVAGISPQQMDVQQVVLLSRIAQEQQDNRLRQATLGVLVTLGRGSDAIFSEQEKLDQRVARTPQVALDQRFMAAISHPQDVGPICDLFQMLGPVITDALGPSLGALGVGRRERVDARDGLPLRNEIAHWAGAIGIEEFHLYVGGKNPTGVTGVPGDPHALVVGNQVSAPLSAGFRQAVARELFAMRRGISVVRSRDEVTVAAIVAGVCNILGVTLNTPQYATLKEVQRLMGKALPRKLKKVLPETCRAVANSRVDPVAWVGAALRSLDRMAALASGDVSWVLADNLGAPRNQLSNAVVENDRALELIAFVLSDQYLELRNQLGMGVR